MYVHDEKGHDKFAVSKFIVLDFWIPDIVSKRMMKRVIRTVFAVSKLMVRVRTSRML